MVQVGREVREPFFAPEQDVLSLDSPALQNMRETEKIQTDARAPLFLSSLSHVHSNTVQELENECCFERTSSPQHCQVKLQFTAR